MFRHKDSVNLRERIVQGAAYNSDNIKKHKALLFEKAAHGRKLWSLAFQRGDQARLHNDYIDLWKYFFYPPRHSAQHSEFRTLNINFYQRGFFKR